MQICNDKPLLRGATFPYIIRLGLPAPASAALGRPGPVTRLLLDDSQPAVFENAAPDVPEAGDAAARQHRHRLGDAVPDAVRIGRRRSTLELSKDEIQEIAADVLDVADDEVEAIELDAEEPLTDTATDATSTFRANRTGRGGSILDPLAIATECISESAPTREC